MSPNSRYRFANIKDLSKTLLPILSRDTGRKISTRLLSPFLKIGVITATQYFDPLLTISNALMFSSAVLTATNINVSFLRAFLWAFSHVGRLRTQFNLFFSISQKCTFKSLKFKAENKNIITLNTSL